MFLLLAFLDIGNAKKLTLDDAVLNSPFNIASMGWFTSFPNENSILIRGEGTKWKEWYKVDLIKNDTVLFIDSLALNWKGNDLFVNTLSLSKNGRKLLLSVDKEKIWRHSFKATFFTYDIFKRDCRLYPMIIKSYGMLSSHLIRSLYPTLGMIIIFICIE